MVAAYLQALLKHDVYIIDINKEGETKCWKLDKVLYGLKQVGHEWFKTLYEILSTLGMHQCIGDEGTYTNITTKVTSTPPDIIGTHGDDLIGITPMEQDLATVEKAMEKRVELDKRGKPSNMLGMELHWSEETVILTQTRLIESMASTFLKMDGQLGKRHSLPLEPQYYAKTEEQPSEQPTKNEGGKPQYQLIIGGLLFLARMTRPEISVHVNLLGRRTKDHSARHWTTALYILEYLYSIRYDGLKLRKPENLDITIYTDAVYGGEEVRSQTGVMVTISKQLVG